MKAALENYHARMQRALDHIDQHLDTDLDLETVSRIAAFSKFHFHRQFMATFGVSVHRYVQLARMKRASGQLASKDAQSVTDIALDAGYDAPDAFARAFFVAMPAMLPGKKWRICLRVSVQAGAGAFARYSILPSFPCASHAVHPHPDR